MEAAFKLPLSPPYEAAHSELAVRLDAYVELFETSRGMWARSGGGFLGSLDRPKVGSAGASTTDTKMPATEPALPTGALPKEDEHAALQRVVDDLIREGEVRPEGGVKPLLAVLLRRHVGYQRKS